MTEVERGWFRLAAAAQPVPYVCGSEDNLDGDFNDTETADPTADFAALRREIELADAAVADCRSTTLSSIRGGPTWSTTSAGSTGT
ncbi:hypothetical protein NONI108955_43965 [Nocardia ninae]